jgi:hypothetical protein
MTSVCVNGVSAKGGACRRGGSDSKETQSRATLLECAPRALAQGQQHARAGLRGAGLRGANGLLPRRTRLRVPPAALRLPALRADQGGALHVVDASGSTLAAEHRALELLPHMASAMLGGMPARVTSEVAALPLQPPPPGAAASPLALGCDAFPRNLLVLVAHACAEPPGTLVLADAAGSSQPLPIAVFAAVAAAVAAGWRGQLLLEVLACFADPRDGTAFGELRAAADAAAGGALRVTLSFTTGAVAPASLLASRLCAWHAWMQPAALRASAGATPEELLFHCVGARTWYVLPGLAEPRLLGGDAPALRSVAAAATLAGGVPLLQLRRDGELRRVGVRVGVCVAQSARGHAPPRTDPQHPPRPGTRPATRRALPNAPRGAGNGRLWARRGARFRGQTLSRKGYDRKSAKGVGRVRAAAVAPKHPVRGAARDTPTHTLPRAPRADVFSHNPALTGRAKKRLQRTTTLPPRATPAPPRRPRPPGAAASRSRAAPRRAQRRARSGLRPRAAGSGAGGGRRRNADKDERACRCGRACRRSSSAPPARRTRRCWLRRRTESRAAWRRRCGAARTWRLRRRCSRQASVPRFCTAAAALLTAPPAHRRRAAPRTAHAPGTHRSRARARTQRPPTAQDGWSALHFACAQGRADMALLLLDAGAAPDAATDDAQRTPLHWAARNGHADAVRLLLRRGAATAARDVDGCAPLHLAAAAKDDTTIDVARLLLEVGADVEPRRKVRACVRACVRAVPNTTRRPQRALTVRRPLQTPPAPARPRAGRFHAAAPRVALRQRARGGAAAAARRGRDGRHGGTCTLPARTHARLINNTRVRACACSRVPHNAPHAPHRPRAERVDAAARRGGGGRAGHRAAAAGARRGRVPRDAGAPDASRSFVSLVLLLSLSGGLLGVVTLPAFSVFAPRFRSVIVRRRGARRWTARATTRRASSSA